MAVILILKSDTSAPTHDAAIQAITAALTLGGLVLVSNSVSTSFNPAVTVGLAMFSKTLDLSFIAYFLGPLIGGGIAGVFSHLHKTVLLKQKMLENERNNSLSFW